MVLKLNGKTAEGIGLAILGFSGSFSIWSAINTSLFSSIRMGVRDGTQEDIKDIKFGMDLGLGIISAFSLGLPLAFGKRAIPAGIASFLTGVGLYALFYFKVVNKGKQNKQCNQCKQVIPMGGNSGY